MPRETTSRRAVLSAIESVDAISELSSRDGDHFNHELDLEVVVYGRNYNGKRVGPYVHLFSFDAGEVIVNEGEWGGNSFFILVEGKADVLLRTANGEVRVREIGPGTQFGEMSVLAGVPRAATVRVSADGSAQVLEIERPALRLLRKLPKFSEHLDAEYRNNGRSATLQNLQALTSLEPPLIQQLESVSQFRIYSKGHILFSQGEQVRRVYLLHAGWAKLKSNLNDSEVFAGANSSFGIEGLSQAVVWDKSCILQSRSEVLEISITKLQNLPVLRKRLAEELSGVSPQPAQQELSSELPVVAAQKRLIETGLADATNLLVMDMDLCIRCGNCSLACHKVHGQTRLVRRGLHIGRPMHVRPAPSAEQSLLAPAVCLHCQDPECLTGCPTGAIQRLPGGEVDIDSKTCIGCGDCAAQCPYNAISMVPRKPAAGQHRSSLWSGLFSLGAEALPAPVEQTDDLLAVKCNLCAHTPLNPEGTAIQAYSCEENCPTGALLRVSPDTYFPEIRILEGRRVVRAGKGAQLRRTVKDHSLRLAHVTGILVTLMCAIALGFAVYSYGLESSVFSEWIDWLNLRWITGIGGLLVMIFVMAYPLRRQIYRRRAGPLRYWMLAHAYAGLIGAIVLIVHGGTDAGGALTTTLAVTFDLVILTGLFGIACYYIVPRILTRIEEQPLLIEDLELRRDELWQAMQANLGGASTATREYVESALFPRLFSMRYLFGTFVSSSSLETSIATEIERLRAISTSSHSELHTELQSIEKMARELVILRRVDALIALHRLLKVWIVPHVVTTALMLALMLVHIVQVVYFAGAIRSAIGNAEQISNHSQRPEPRPAPHRE